MRNQKKKKRRNSGLIYAALFCSSLTAVGGVSYAREMIPYPRIKLQTLDKGTARTMTFEANVGSTLKFGTLYMKVQSCQKSAPVEMPESAAFIQIWEVSPEKSGQKKEKEEESQWVFSGWMFASSPALSAMDHPLYDVWVVECLGDGTEQQVQAAPSGEAAATEGAATGDGANTTSTETTPAPDPMGDLLQELQNEEQPQPPNPAEETPITP